MQQQDFTLPYPPLQVRAGVLVADGYGIRINCLYGKLHVEDGIGLHRRSIALDRTGSDAAGGRLERLVLLGKSFSITGEVIAWLRAIGAAWVVLSPDGNLLAESVPIGYAGEPIRRAQALAPGNGLGVTIARELIGYKIDGERRNLVRLRVQDLDAFDRLRETLDRAATIDAIRLCEAQAAAIYWNAWKHVSIRFRGRDLARIPSRWTRFDSRASALTGAPRAATNPICALVNFCHSIAESEARLAILAHGMDVMLGVMHSDLRGRASFVFDCLEPVYPDVESFILDVLQERTLTARDFVELPNGVTRVRAPLTHELALTSGRWRQALAPIIARVAQIFRSAQTGRVDANGATPPTRPSRNARRDSTEPLHTVGGTTESPRTHEGNQPRKASKIPHRSAQVPLSATPRKAPVPRPYTSKAWTAPRPEALALIPAACARCGKPVVKRRRRHCEDCMPQARREHGLRVIERAREALRLQTLAGNDPRAGAETNRKRGEAIAEQRRRNRQWKRENPDDAGHDRAWFLREVMPKLDDLPLSAIASVSGLSLAACSRYRNGTRIPHPRHWELFCTLVGLTREPSARQ